MQPLVGLDDHWQAGFEGGEVVAEEVIEVGADEVGEEKIHDIA